MKSLIEKAKDAQVEVGLELLARDERDLTQAVVARLAQRRALRGNLVRARRRQRIVAAAVMLLGVGVTVFVVTRPRPEPVEVPAAAEPAAPQGKKLVPVVVRTVAAAEGLPRDTRAVRVVDNAALLGVPLGKLPMLEQLEIAPSETPTPLLLHPKLLYEWIPEHKKLRRLTLERVQAPDPGMFASLPMLEHLGLLACTGMELPHFERLRELASLTSLDLGDTRAVDDAVIDVISRLEGLRVLRLPGVVGGMNAGVTSEGLARLATLTRLVELDLSGIDIRRLVPRGERLGALGVQQVGPVDDDVLRSLAKLTALRRLTLRDSGAFTSAGLAAIAHAAPLEELVLSDNDQLDDSIWADLPPTLRRLEISDCKDLGRAVPKVMPSLEHLSVVNVPRLSDRAIERIAGWPELRHLFLLVTPEVTAASLPHFARMKHLESLSLSLMGWLDDEALRVFARLTSLKNLDVSGAKRGVKPAAGPAAKPLAKGADDMTRVVQRIRKAQERARQARAQRADAIAGWRSFSGSAIAGLAALERLEVLRIKYNQPVAVASLAALSRCPLQVLDLKGTEIVYDERIPDRAALERLWPGVRLLLAEMALQTLEQRPK